MSRPPTRRRSRREDPLDVHIPDPIVTRDDGDTPEDEALLADSVGLALLVVLETLQPAERVAFVLHDMFAVPFDEIARLLDRSPAAVRQLASRARRRVQGEARLRSETWDGNGRWSTRSSPRRARVTSTGWSRFSTPTWCFGSTAGSRAASSPWSLRGAETVAAQARTGKTFAPYVRRVLVNGSPGALVVMKGRVITLMSFTVADGRVAEMDIIVEPDRLAALDLADVLS